MAQKRISLSQIFFVFIILLMFLPMIVSFIPSMKGPELYGVSAENKNIIKDSISWNHYWEGGFQTEIERIIKQNIGFSNHWIRFNNELNFRLFRYTNAEKLVLGKHDNFYEEMYITEYLGRNYIGDRYIQKKVILLKRLQRLLKDKYGVTMLLVFEPGKAHFSPAEIPDRYHPEIKDVSNYEQFVRFCNQEKVDYLDLNDYFLKKKQNSPHLLYSKYGVHWSSYGLWVATEQLAQFIENKCDIDLPDFTQVGDSSSTMNKDLDFDMEPPMNLLCELPHEKMYFPIYSFQNDTSRHTQPRTLTVGDSYYWSIYNSGISYNLFKDNIFWYYNKAVYPHIFDPNIQYADKSSLKELIQNQDLILLMITDANLYNFGWNFIEEALQALDNTYKEETEITTLNMILSDKNWYSTLLKESQQKQKPFDVILYQTVEYERKQLPQ